MGQRVIDGRRRCNRMPWGPVLKLTRLRAGNMLIAHGSDGVHDKPQREALYQWNIEN
jgi:hypothetical protein